MALLYQVIISVLLIQLCVVSHPTENLQKLSPEDAERLASWKPGDEPMWQISGQFEGDIVLTPEQRNGVVDTRLRWPNKVIPYEFSSAFNEAEKEIIRNALEYEYNRRTCITVRPRVPSDTDYVLITAEDSGCWSNVGRIGGMQPLNLKQNGCVYYHIVAHEFLHAAGFYHQQSATERDDFVTIQLENIEDGKAYNFDKYPSSMINSFGQKYDYTSIMHYEQYAFSKNKERTIITKDPYYQEIIGQGRELSDIDIIKLNKMYNC